MNKLTKIFIVVIVGLIAFMVVTAPEIKKVNRAKAGFHVNASDRLYFKNIRQYYYASRPTEKGQFDALHLKEAIAQKAYPLRFRILNNWRMDEAYIMLADSNDMAVGSVVIELDSSIKWDLSGLNANEHLDLAIATFEALQLDPRESRFFYETKLNNRIEIWKEEKDRQLTRTVLKDYFKLTGAL